MGCKGGCLMQHILKAGFGKKLEVFWKMDAMLS